mmetsp:Transcript_12613/g.22475  ORF Transcript_12613/g.22475 Transcript_12613/m.22475 type:complete len:211 (-) Transcript_12613:17-649(-)
MTLSLSTWPRRRSTVFIETSFSFMGRFFFSLISFFKSFTLTRTLCFSMYALYFGTRSAKGRAWIGSSFNSVNNCLRLLMSSERFESLILRSFKGSNRGISPSLNLLRTSLRLLRMASRLLFKRRSEGVWTRSELTVVMSESLKSLTTGTAVASFASHWNGVSPLSLPATRTFRFSGTFFESLPRRWSTDRTIPQDHPAVSATRRPVFRKP